ncbi:uncharacterized protein LOC114937137 [Nylanderia fulva]|uniref:uncharacterized protein LOC114937137 n=1 Tax=Nylanderia fulva TaxID=613905 RepID=UPI0010FB97A2|nr:uncharacterized protein LOC114937137 [Nylanderia fulva]XP_029166376.1 uncharacterized protein LOC114937137 [Nylanderia fulva]XP_029166377.1 uncharacterized protein LOC114937137 [Nylanderia fulva]XP_029166379.1 uncharacterized protein LOC114937137 [Nylanderia fulva]
MNLRENIKKATSLDYIDSNAKFFRLSGLSQAAKDRKMNERKVKKPRNLNLMEDSNDDSDNDVENYVNKIKNDFDHHAVSAAIKEVNGGRDLSNKHWERVYMKRLENITNSEKEISPKTSNHNNITYSGSQPENLTDRINKQNNKLRRNAAIMGLVKLKQFSLENLFNPSSEISARKEDKLETLHEVTDTYMTDNDNGQVESVPLYEDSEIFVHPLQVGIDEKKFKNIDFTVSRIGKKTKIIPQEHFLMETDDDFFNFVKKEKNTK